jgi:hypothetical protein
MNDNTAFATKSSRRPVSDGPTPSNISVWRRARRFAHFAFVPLLAVLLSGTALAQTIHVAGQLLIDVNATRGLSTNTGMSTVAGETNVIAWTNYGILGGKFDAALTSVFNTGIYAGSYTSANTNPPAYTNFGGVLAPASPAGARIMILSSNTPSQMLGNSHYSVECWFYNLTTADPRGVFGWTLAAPPAGDAGELGAAATASWHNDSKSVPWVPGAVAPSTGAWHYGVITYDGTTESVYLDGNLSNSVVHALNIVGTNATGALANPVIFSQLGAIPATTTSSSLNGAIASLRAHTDALSAADVANNFAAGIAAVPPPVNLSVQINPVTAISGTPGTPNSGKATLSALIQSTLSPSTTVVTFLYDTIDHGRTTNGWAHSITLAAPNSVGPVSLNIFGLALGTLYYVRAYTTDSADTNLSTSVSFNSVGAPGIQNSSAFFASPGSDYLLGNVTLDGDGSGQAYVILYWGPANGGSVAANWAHAVNLGATPIGAFNYQVSGLTTQGNYYFTYAATNGYGVTWATPSLAFQEGLLFSLNTTNLPAATSNVTTYASSAGTFALGEGTPTVQDFGGTPWLATVAASEANLYLPPASFPGGAPATIPINGGTVVAAVKPESPPAAGPWENIVAVFFSELGLGMNITTTTVPGGSVASVTITNGGTNYTTAPTVTFSAPGGIPSMDSTATGTAVLGTGTNAGKVVSVTITSGGSGYAPDTGTAAGDVPPPTVTFSGGGGSNAAGTAVMTSVSGLELLADVNSFRPLDDATNQIADGRNNRGRAFLPYDQVSVVSLVAGSGASSGTPGDNNYRLYINGVLVEDTDWGYVTGVTITSGGSGYTNSSGVAVPPTVTFPAPLAPGGTQATGVAVVNTNGVVTSVTITSPGSGYTGNGVPGAAGANPVVTFSAPPTAGGATATGIASGVNLGLYSKATGAFGAYATGMNGGGMTSLNYMLQGAGYGPYATFCVGQDAYTIDPWSGFGGYIGDVYVYGEALPDATRKSLENQLAAKFIPAAPVTYTITYSADANSSITPVAYYLNSSAAGVTTAYQGENQTYTLAAATGYSLHLSVDGGAATLVTTGSTYTFTNVSASHTIALTSSLTPSQQVTVTYGANGSVSTNGTTVPSGTALFESGGSSPAFQITPTNGFVIGTVTVDGTAVAKAAIVAASGIYTFANIGAAGGSTNHTINATFVSLPASPVAASIPQSDYLLFALDTTQLPTNSGTTITNWPLYFTTTAQTNMIQGNGGGTPSRAVTLTDANNVVWEVNVEGEGTPTTGYQLYTAAVGVPTGTVIPNNGATIVVACNPTYSSAGTGDPWHAIVDVFFGCLELSVQPGTGLIQALVDNDNGGYDGITSPIATSTVAIPNGSNAVLSLVAQSNGSFAVYFNTVMVITNAGLGPLYLKAGNQGFTFANNILIGDDGPDTWSAFNGLIGNTYVYTTALSTADRSTLEAALMTQFHAVVPPNYNWNGTNNANWSSVTSWSNTVPLANNTVPGAGTVPVFSVTNTAGQTVQVDQFGITVAGLAFNSNAVNTIIASKAGNALTLDSGAQATSAAISVSAGSSPTISNALTVLEGLNTTGAGTLTLAGAVSTGAGGTGYGGHLNAYGNLNLSGNVNIGGGTVVAYLRVARDTSSTAVLTQKAGTVTTFSVGEDWTGAGNGPGVGLGGYDNSATHATYNLNGGTLIIPNIGCVASTNGVLVPASTYGGSAILNLNGGVLEPSGSDLTSAEDASAVTEGSAHLIFNTTHTWVQAGGAIFNTGGNGFSNSIAVPLEHYPNGPDVDGGLTVTGAGGTIALLSSATYTGPTKVASGTLICMATNSIGGTSLDIENGAVVNLSFTGTIPVYQLTLNAGSPLPAGTYGATGSGAANIDNTHFAGTGTVTVLGSVTGAVAPKFTGTAFAAGNLVLQGTGGRPGGSFLIMGSTNVAAALTNWVTLGVGTFTGSGFSVSIPVTNTVPQEFIQLVIP